MSYLKNFEKIIRDERQMKALTGVNKDEFVFLVDLFKEIDLKIKEEEYEERKQKDKNSRPYSVWAKAKLDTYEKKIFFLLCYLKTYPTFDVLSFWFWMWRSTACENMHSQLLILLRLLQELWISPKRKIETSEDLKEAFSWDIATLILDWTERKHFRHKDNEKQKKHYSGKKNYTQRKIQ